MANEPEKHTHLTLTLIENGIDFVRSGIEHYFLLDAPSPRDHKYAVLHVFAGVLLLLKARLSREHPALIFVRVEDVGNAESLTVNFKQVVDRLETVAKVNLTAYRATLDAAQRARNRLEHYEVSLKLSETQELVGRLCEFVYLFLRDELGEDLQTHLRGAVWDRVQELRGVAEAIEKKRREDWKQRVAHYAKFTKRQLERAWQDAPRPHPDDGIFVFDPLLSARCVAKSGLSLSTEVSPSAQIPNAGRCLSPVRA